MTIKITITGRRALFALAVGLALSGMGGVALARDSGSRVTPAEVKACYKNATGDLRLKGSNPCPSFWSPISWSQTGPAGPAGQAGPAGPPGISNLQIVRADSAFGDRNGANAACPSGKKLLGGGAQTVKAGVNDAETANDFMSKIGQSFPNAAGTGWIAWHDAYLTAFTGNYKVIAYAICATVN